MSFYQKFGKRSIDIIFSFLALVLLWPLFLLVALLIKLDSAGPVIFKQKRTGKDSRSFTLYKFRTMVQGAEELKEKYRQLNEADGPVFKIGDDPRFTKVGKILSHTGFDELPQFFNVLKGEIGLVGPRPLPINEEAKISSEYQEKRRSVKPGIISSWLIKGAHKLTFKQWMDFDIQDIKKSGFFYDLNIFLKVVYLILRLIKKETF